jgi:glycosyltransferase involved in cell wall biosynthesis
MQANFSSHMVSIVVPVYNGQAHIADCIESLLNQDFKSGSYDIIVVNNRSTDDTANIVKRYPIRNLFEAKLGPAAARNTGIRASSAHFIAFTDADCIPYSNWLSQIIHAMEKGVIGAGGSILSYYGDDPISQYIDEVVFRQRYNILQKIPPHITTANACFLRSALHNIGLFDESFPYAAGEDRDLGERLAMAGSRFVFVPTAAVRHKHPQTLESFYNQRFRHAAGQIYADLKILKRLSIHQMLCKLEISHPLKLTKKMLLPKTSKEERYITLLHFIDKGAYTTGLIWKYVLFLLKNWRDSLKLF